MRKRWHIWGITTFAVAFTAFAMIWIFFVGFDAGRPGYFYNKGTNAVWIGHEWVGTEKSDAEIQSLVEMLEKNQIICILMPKKLE